MNREQSHKKIEIPVTVEEGVELPQYASLGSSGADVRAFLVEEVRMAPRTTVLLPTGIRFEIPIGYEIQVRPRSGLAFEHGITVLNAPGTIDADYRGELKVLLINHGCEEFIITPGMRIAQIVIVPVVQAQFTERKELVGTLRGAGGFGHTGMH